MENGSNLWSWHSAHPKVIPNHVVAVVRTRSLAYFARYSLSWMPNSVLFMLSRLNPAATFCDNVASDSKSPASCSLVKRSKGMFCIECIDHIIPVGPNAPRNVSMVAIGISIAHEVEPVRGQALTETWRCEESIDDGFPGFRGRIADEGGNFLGSWRNSCDIEGRTPYQCAPVGFRRRRVAIALKLCDHVVIDEVCDVFTVIQFHVDRSDTHRRNERPVIRVFTSFGDPLHQEVLFLPAKWFAMLRRRHQPAFILR